MNFQNVTLEAAMPRCQPIQIKILNLMAAVKIDEIVISLVQACLWTNPGAVSYLTLA